MKKTVFLIACGILLLMASCGKKQTQTQTSSTTPMTTEQRAATPIPYIEADNYFVRNDAQIPENPKINTKEEFEKIFGMGSVMGDDGKPTDIDFERQFVIAVIQPATDRDVDMDDERLLDDGQTLTFEYSVDKDREKLSYKIQPFVMIIVDRQYERENIILKKVRD